MHNDLVNCMLENSIYLLLIYKLFIRCRVMATLLKGPDFGIFSTKIF